MRVAKEVAKEDKAKKEKDEKKPAKRPRPGGYQGFQYQAPVMQMPVMAPGPSMYQPQQFQSQGQMSQMTQRIPKALLRCLNCGELGHFVRECTKQITQK